jgi:hypothetical protein
MKEKYKFLNVQFMSDSFKDKTNHYLTFNINISVMTDLESFNKYFYQLNIQLSYIKI